MFASQLSYSHYWCPYDVVSDENECITGNNLCSLQGNCTDLVGGYLCACAEGYKGDGFTCIPGELTRAPSIGQ